MELVSEMSQQRDLRLRDPQPLEDVAERLLRLAGEQEFAFLYALAHCGKGWALCLRGDLAGGTEMIRTGLGLYAATGARLMWGYWATYLIEAHLAAGQLAEGLALVGQALALSETQIDVNYDPEILRLEGELRHASGEAEAAEAAFRKSLGIAREQKARALELRTATSLGRLLAEDGRAEEALNLLSAVSRTFPEGFEFGDLIEARELLERLSSAA
jgi:predicted ATPase